MSKISRWIMNGPLFSLLFTMDRWHQLVKLQLQLKYTIHRGFELLLLFEFQAFADLRHGQWMQGKFSTERIVYLITQHDTEGQLQTFTTTTIYRRVQTTSYNLPLYSSSCFSSTSFVPAFATIVFLVVSISTSRSLMAWKSVHSIIIYVKNNFRQLDVQASTSEISNGQLYNQLSKRGLKYYFVTYLLKSCSQTCKGKAS